MIKNIAMLFGYILNFLYNYIQNYGYSIILFSVLLKLVMLPLTIKQQQSMKKSQKLQGELNKLQIKYKNNPDLLQQETMALYKREKVSPFSGCLGSILQIIIFLSVFYLVSRPLTYMKKVDPQIISNYEQEIQENGQTSNYKEIQIIELKSEEDENVNINMDFLGLNLSKVPMQNWQDFRVFIIPLLYVITTFANMKITSNMNKSKEEIEKKKELKEKKKEEKSNKDIVEENKEEKLEEDSDKVEENKEDGKEKDKVEDKEETAEDQLEAMQDMTKSMTYTMPIMSIGIALIAPLGLSLYWLVSNSLQLIERISINKFSKDDKESKKGQKLLEGKK